MSGHVAIPAIELIENRATSVGEKMIIDTIKDALIGKADPDAYIDAARRFQMLEIEQKDIVREVARLASEHTSNNKISKEIPCLSA